VFAQRILAAPEVHHVRININVEVDDASPRSLPCASPGHPYKKTGIDVDGIDVDDVGVAGFHDGFTIVELVYRGALAGGIGSDQGVRPTCCLR
jgi:hypothetical protein